MEEAKVSNPTVEIEAMSKVAEALKDLDISATKRVLKWAASYFVLNDTNVDSLNNDSPPDDLSAQASPIVPAYQSVAELFHDAEPETAADRALTVAYWLQQIQQHSDFSSQSVNDALKNLGYGISNITDAFTQLLDKKLALQIQKSGKSQQARKKYKLTLRGIESVEKMIAENKSKAA